VSCVVLLMLTVYGCVTAGVVDSNALMAFYEGTATQNDAEVLYNVEVENIKPIESQRSSDPKKSLGYQVFIKVCVLCVCCVCVRACACVCVCESECVRVDTSTATPIHAVFSSSFVCV